MHPQFIVVTDRSAFRAGWIEPDPLEPLLKAQAGGSLKAQAGGSLKAQAGGSLKAQAGGSLKAQAGSSLKAQAGSSPKAQAGGSLTTPPPGRMPVPRPPKIRWVSALDFVHPRQHFVEQVTDLSGSYSAAASSGMGGAPRRMPSSPSDVHWKLEADRRAVADLARAIEAVLSQEKPETWILSAPTDIHNTLEETIARPFREHLLGVVPKNLVHADTASLLEHFLPFRRKTAGVAWTDAT